jgi:hypothetical protein
VLSTLTVGAGHLAVSSHRPLGRLHECCGRSAAEMCVASGCLLRLLRTFENQFLKLRKLKEKKICGACGSLYGIERKYGDGSQLGDVKKVELRL